MTGKACVSIFPFYDNKKRKMAFKNRPILVVGQADSKDYVVLPISRVTNSQNIDPYFDVPLNPTDVPHMNLKQCSYVRTHKQTIINAAQIKQTIVNFQEEYTDIYFDIIAKMEEFQKSTINNAL